MTAPLGNLVAESTARLAVGVEVLDAARGGPAEVRVAVEDVPGPHRVPVPRHIADRARASYDVGLGLPLLQSARPGRFAVPFTRRTRSPVPVRVFDERRRFVPRRLRIPFEELAAVLAEEVATQLAPFPLLVGRGRRIRVFPGAGYGPHSSATGIRGRVLRASGRPARWARVRARHGVQDVELGRAHGDDRGEFLLLLGAPPTALAVPAATTFEVRVDVTAHPAPPTGGPATGADDPLADLPVEVLPPLGEDDPISAGATDPPGYTAAVAASVSCRLGELTSPVPFRLPPNP